MIFSGILKDEFFQNLSIHLTLLLAMSLSGYSLNEVLDDLLQFDFTTSLWREVLAGSPKPVSHSTVSCW